MQKIGASCSKGIGQFSLSYGIYTHKWNKFVEKLQNIKIESHSQWQNV
jgi:hypothetical protein